MENIKELTNSTLRNNQRRLCAQAKRAHVKTWEVSGLSIRAYANKQGLHYATFHKWIGTYKIEHPPQFIPVVVNSAKTLSQSGPAHQSNVSSSTNAQELNIKTSQGLDIQIHSLTQPLAVAQLLKELGSCN